MGIEKFYIIICLVGAGVAFLANFIGGIVVLIKLGGKINNVTSKVDGTAEKLNKFFDEKGRIVLVFKDEFEKYQSEIKEEFKALSDKIDGK